MKPNVEQEVATSQAPRRVTIDTPCKKSLLSRRTEEHVQQVMDIFFPLTDSESSSFFPNARCWSQTKNSTELDPKVFFFQFLLLLCESRSEGSAMPDERYESNAGNYLEAARLAGLLLTHSANAQQKEVLKKMVKQDFVFDARFLHLVAAQVKMKKASFSTAAKGGGGKGKGGKKNGAPPPPAAGAGGAELKELPDLDYQLAYYAIEVLDIGDDTLLPCPNLFEDVFPPAPPPPPAAGAEAPPSAPELDELAESYIGPIQLPKIRFCVCPTPNEDGDIIGILCRFIIMDPAIHPGKFYDAVIENREKRLRNVVAKGGGGGGRGGSGFKDLFPDYGIFYHTRHPAGNKVSKQMYFLAAEKLFESAAPRGAGGGGFEAEGGDADSLGDRMACMDYLSESSPYHLKNLLSTERACREMREAGVAAQYCSSPLMWYDKLAKKCMFPLQTYKYAATQVFWYSKINIGLSEQFFPHVDLSTDFLGNLLAGKDFERFLPEELRNAPSPPPPAGGMGGLRSPTPAPRSAGGGGGGASLSIYDRRRRLIETHPVISRDELLSNNLIPYETNNEYLHKAAEAKLINKRVNQECPAHYLETLDKVQMLRLHEGAGWRASLLMDEQNAGLLERIRECERYNEIRRLAQMACLQVFESLWLLDGDVDSLSIPETIKTIQKWYIDNRFPNMTRRFCMWDPGMSMFGNGMLRKIKIYSCIALILQPIICMLAQGLFSVYHHQPRTILFNMMLPGRFDVGKTFAGITTLMNYTAIEGTVIAFTQQTKAADTTRRHNYDRICVSDEVAPWKVSLIDAKKNEELVNKEKVKMTDLQVGLQCYVNAVGPNGENVRWTENILTDHVESRLECTNAVVEAANPLASRYFRMTVAQPRIPARLMTTKVGDAIHQENVTHLRINHYLTAWYCKAEMCGAVMPDVEMTLFDDVANRVINYLSAARVVDKSFGKRGLDILKPYVRQLVYSHAIHCTFDMPNGPCYKQPFTNACVRAMQPYCYVTVDMIYWGFTAMAGIFFEENIANVVQALRKAVGIDAKNQFAHNYEMFEHDTKNGGEGQIKWKMMENHNFDKKSQTYVMGDEQLVDLTYVCFKGKDLQSMCGSIASFTNPVLSWTDVRGVLNILQALQVPIKHAFMPQPYGTFKKWHKYLELPVPSTGFAGRKEIDGLGSLMPMEYRQRNPTTTEYRTYEDVPLFDHERYCTAIEVFSDRIYFMPDIDQCFQSQKIVEALEYATLCKTTRAGKILLGFAEDHDATQMQVYNLHQHVIDQHIANYDEADGWRINARTGQLDWIGPQNVPEDQRPISRRLGICFDRRGGLTKTDSTFFNSVPAAPILDDENSMSKWKSKIADDIARMNEPLRIVADLDYESAKRQHMACGRGLDEPVLSPAYIEQTYKAKCTEMGMEWHMNMDYPHDHLLEKDALETQWEIHGGINNQIAIGAQHYREARVQNNVPRTAELRLKIARQKESHRGTKRERDTILNMSMTHVPLDSELTNSGPAGDASWDMTDLRGGGGGGREHRMRLSLE